MKTVIHREDCEHSTAPIENMSINHRSFNILMAEKFLHRAVKWTPKTGHS